MDIKILIIEDEKPAQEYLAGLIKQLEPAVKILAKLDSVQSSVEWLRNNTADLIFMDIQMPEVDGLEAARQIRIREANAGEPRIPIVALSGNAMADDIEAAKLAGCDSHLAKPVRRDQLIASLVQFCPAEIRPAR